MSKTATAAVVTAGLVLAGALGTTYALADQGDPKPPSAEIHDGYSKPVEKGKLVGVVDLEGDEVGLVDPSAMERANSRIMERMKAAGIRDTSTIAEEETAAYQVLEAVPVTDVDGRLTGYLAGGYLTVADYEASVDDARVTVEAVEARQHD